MTEMLVLLTLHYKKKFSLPCLLLDCMEEQPIQKFISLEGTFILYLYISWSKTKQKANVLHGKCFSLPQGWAHGCKWEQQNCARKRVQSAIMRRFDSFFNTFPSTFLLFSFTSMVPAQRGVIHLTHSNFCVIRAWATELCKQKCFSFF